MYRESGLVLFVNLPVSSSKNFVPTKKENSYLTSGPVSVCVSMPLMSQPVAKAVDLKL